MPIVFRFDPTDVSVAETTLRILNISVSRGSSAEGEGVAIGALMLAHKLRQAGLGSGYSGVISFVCHGSLDPMSMSSVAHELRAAGWARASYQTASAELSATSMRDSVYAGPLASRALKALGARAFTVEGSIPTADFASPEDRALYAHEKLHVRMSGGASRPGAGESSASEEAAARAVERMVLKL